MNFQEAMAEVLKGRRVKRPHWKWWIKLGGIEPSNPRKGSIQFGYSIVHDNTAQNHYDFYIDDLTSHDWEVEDEASLCLEEYGMDYDRV
jgi:hypothetical protein